MALTGRVCGDMLWHVSISLKSFSALNGYNYHSNKHQTLNGWASPEKCVDVLTSTSQRRGG